MSETKELLPCPFCGGVASLLIGEHNFHDAKVRCDDCSAETGCYDKEDGDPDFHSRDNIIDTIAAWNTRTPPKVGKP